MEYAVVPFESQMKSSRSSGLWHTYCLANSHWLPASPFPSAFADRRAAAYGIPEVSYGSGTHRMIQQLLIAWCLMASNVVIHAYGVVAALERLRRQDFGSRRLASWTWLFVGLAGWIVLLHVAEIMVWAFAYRSGQAMPDLPSAMYFSAVTYTTTGYGDLVLPPSWRLVGAVEALTGILMCGWSTGVFFAVLNRGLKTAIRR